MPDAHVGAVLSDLSGRRGRVTGTEPDPTAPLGMERTVVHAEVPDAEGRLAVNHLAVLGLQRRRGDRCCWAAGSIWAISERGARSRVQATGVGAPDSDSTVTTASPVPSCCSAPARS